MRIKLVQRSSDVYKSLETLETTAVKLMVMFCVSRVSAELWWWILLSTQHVYLSRRSQRPNLRQHVTYVHSFSPADESIEMGVCVCSVSSSDVSAQVCERRCVCVCLKGYTGIFCKQRECVCVACFISRSSCFFLFFWLHHWCLWGLTRSSHVSNVQSIKVDFTAIQDELKLLLCSRLKHM